jgi:multidrug efflux pump subunit AcrB
MSVKHIATAGDVGLVRLKNIADDLEDMIEAIPGVPDATVIGDLNREMRIEPHPDRLTAYEIPMAQLLALIEKENANVAGGNIDLPEAKFQVRVSGEFVDPREAQRKPRVLDGRCAHTGYIQGPRQLLSNRRARIRFSQRAETGRRKRSAHYRPHQADCRELPLDTSEGSASGSHLARVAIDFLEMENRKQPSRLTLQEIREDVTGVTGVEIEVQEEQHGPPQEKPISIEISGEDFSVLERITRDVKKRIENVPGIVDLRDNYEQARPELRFRVDRKRAALLDLSAVTIANFIKTAVLGWKVGTFRQGEDEYDITVRLAKEDRDDLRELLCLYVPGSGGKPIPLSSLATVEYAGGLGSINREDQKRVVTVESGVEGRLPNDALADVQGKLKDLRLPAGYTMQYKGQQEDQKEASDFLTKAFIVALFLIALVLVTQFNSIALTAIIMVSVILSLIGVFVGLLVTGLPFGSIMTGIGVISLAGVVVNNAIVLIDYIQILRKQGMPCREALARAGMVRRVQWWHIMFRPLRGARPRGHGSSATCIARGSYHCFGACPDGRGYQLRFPPVPPCYRKLRQPVVGLDGGRRHLRPHFCNTAYARRRSDNVSPDKLRHGEDT